MKLSISVKLFIGFLVVIFLNVFFVVVVSKLSDLNTIVNILKRQTEVKNALLRIQTLHDNQARNYLIYNNVRTPGSIDNFREATKDIHHLLDTVMASLDAIRAMDTITGAAGEPAESRQKLTDLITSVSGNLKHHHGTYVGAFENLVHLHEEPASTNLTQKARLTTDIISEASDSLTGELRTSQALLDEETGIRIKDIDVRINNVKRLTLLILVGMSIFALLFAFLFSRAITVSLRKLKISARLIAKGNFDFDPAGYPRDEIGELAKALFDMAYDLKNAQEELVKSKRLAAIGEVIASVNHEINNPLMIISGNAQFLEMSMEGYPADLRERLKAIIEETERISRVTRKLREIKNPVVEDYTSSGEQMINLDKSTN
jgi:nitrogen fixation/metabolism regulation signal transduction histidine kinase